MTKNNRTKPAGETKYEAAKNSWYCGFWTCEFVKILNKFYDKNCRRSTEVIKYLIFCLPTKIQFIFVTYFFYLEKFCACEIFVPMKTCLSKCAYENSLCEIDSCFYKSIFVPLHFSSHFCSTLFVLILQLRRMHARNPGLRLSTIKSRKNIIFCSDPESPVSLRSLG